jgi:hypothetical protein
MNELELLRKALYEADEEPETQDSSNNMLSDEFHVITDKSNMAFNGKLSYTGDSRIALELTTKMPDVVRHLKSSQQFNSISEEQFKEASEKIQNALKEVLEQSELLLKNKLASYGLEGETQNG